jgi:hypothetical protein
MILICSFCEISKQFARYWVRAMKVANPISVPYDEPL